MRVKTRPPARRGRATAALGVLATAATLAAGQPARAGDLRRTPVVVAVEKAAPAVVNIATEQLVARREDPAAAADPVFEEFFRNFAEPRFEEKWELSSLGSGTIVDARGYVLTNAHVIQRASRIQVLLADRREFQADVAGTDAESDLALLRLRGAEKLPHVSLGTSADLMIGETLIAIGNPFGLSHSVTVGVLSARSRTVRAGTRVFGDFLQTDASINPGNSGGPILNLEGEVIGIATAIYSSGHGIGFAIPADRARRFVDAILTHGSVRPAWIGIEVKAAGAAVAAGAGASARGALVVTHVVEGSPADGARVAIGDVLVAVGGEPVDSPSDLDAKLASRSASAAVKLELARGSRRVAVSVRPLQEGSPHLMAIAEAVLGIRLSERAGGEPGLVIDEILAAGRGEARGFRAGDIVYEVDGVKVDGLEAFKKAFFQSLLKRTALLLVQHGETAYYVPVALD